MRREDRKLLLHIPEMVLVRSTKRLIIGNQVVRHISWHIVVVRDLKTSKVFYFGITLHPIAFLLPRFGRSKEQGARAWFFGPFMAGCDVGPFN